MGAIAVPWRIHMRCQNWFAAFGAMGIFACSTVAPPPSERELGNRSSETALEPGMDPGSGPQGGALSALADADPAMQYLVMTLNNIPPQDFVARGREVVEFFDTKGSVASKRLLAIGIFGPNPLRESTTELATVIEKGFDMAETLDVPVKFRLDDTIGIFPGSLEYAWWADPTMCESNQLPRPGEVAGPCRPQYFNWGSWLAAPGRPAYASPAWRSFLAKQIREGIFPSLKGRLQRLHDSGRTHLFAGFAIGTETGFHKIEAPEVPAAYRGILGMNSLHWMANTRPDLLGGRSPSALLADPNALLDVLNVALTWDYANFIGRLFSEEGGVPRHLLATHMVPREMLRPGSDLRYAPSVKAATNSWTLPGFTMSPCSTDTSPDIFNVVRGQFLEQDQTLGNPTGYDLRTAPTKFAVEETYATCFPHAGAFHSFLGSTFGSGAKFVNVLGWPDGPESAFAFPRDKNHYVNQMLNGWLRSGVVSGTTFDVVGAGLFQVGPGVYYSNGADAYCWLSSPTHLEQCGWAGTPVASRLTLPTGLRADPICECGGFERVQRAGLFRDASDGIGGTVFYSNGTDAYCALTSPAQLQTCGYGTLTTSLRARDNSAMRYDGVCACGR